MKLRIDKEIYGGDGLARVQEGGDAGRAVAVPYCLAGELVDAELLPSRKPLADALLRQIIEPSPARVTPACVHFGECGGCQYQHAEYSQQLAMKQAILAETLVRAGVKSLPAIEVHSAEPWGYRNRIRLHVRTHNGKVRLGYKRRSSNEFLPVVECPIASPLLWQAAKAALGVEAASNTRGVLRAGRELELFCNHDESEVQLTIFAADSVSPEDFSTWCNALASQVPQLRGAGIETVATEVRKKSALLAAAVTWGSELMDYVAAGRTYSISRGAFFQVNRFLVDELVSLVTKNRTGGETWDLYAGAGLFSKALAERFVRVIAVESALPAAADLQRMLTSAGTAHRALAIPVLEFLKSHAGRKKIVPPDLVVADPPRAGLGADVCAALGVIAAPQMVYVSCDPTTLARDLATLIESGYQVTQLHMIDLFPQTFHLETIAVLQHRTA